MKTTIVDPDGTVRCPVCGATSFRSQRSVKGKATAGAAGVATLGVGGVLGAVFAPKRLKCDGCGEYLKAAGSNESRTDKLRANLDERQEAAPTAYGTGTVNLGEAAVKGFGCSAELAGDALQATFSRMLRNVNGTPAAVSIPLADITDVAVTPATFQKNGNVRVRTADGKRVELLFSYRQRSRWEAFAERVEQAALAV